MSPVDPPISNLISHLKPFVPHSDFVRAKRDLNLRESRLKSEKEEISREFTEISKDNGILTKQVEQWRREHGELLISKQKADQELFECRVECSDLTEKLQKLQSEKEEIECKFHDLREQKAAMEAELSLSRLEIEGLRERGIGSKEKSLMEELEKKEYTELLNKNMKLKRNYNAVIDDSRKKYRELQLCLSKMEQNVTILRVQQDGGNHVKEQLDSFLSNVKIEGLVESLVSEIRSLKEKIPSSKPCVYKTTSTSSPIITISDSDDDDDDGDDDNEPFSERFKRMRCVSEVSKNSEKEIKDLRSDSILGSKIEMQLDSFGKNKLEALKHGEMKVGVKFNGKNSNFMVKSVGSDFQNDTQGEYGSSRKEWEYEEDMLAALRSDLKLCTKAVCALYRQHCALGVSSTSSSVSGHRGFKNLYVSRGNFLGRFLVDGDLKRGMKRSLAELQAINPGAADECRKIAFGHSKQLFEIYKNKEDPFFAP